MMKIADINFGIGHYPFRKLRYGSLDAVRKMHLHNGINFGVCSSFEAIFYNDPFEADIEVKEAIRGTAYRQACTVNPMLPGIYQDIEQIDPAGVRIYPNFHGYSILNAKVFELCAYLEKRNLPLFLNLRSDDIRTDYLLRQSAVSLEDITALSGRFPGLVIILLGTRVAEAIALKECFESARLYTDVSGFKDGIFPFEDVFGAGVPTDRILYGSNFGLYCLKSTLMLVTEAPMEESIKQDILYHNANRLGII